MTIRCRDCRNASSMVSDNEVSINNLMLLNESSPPPSPRAGSGSRHASSISEGSASLRLLTQPPHGAQTAFSHMQNPVFGFAFLRNVYRSTRTG